MDARLAGERLEVVVTSCLARAIDTGAAIASALGLPHHRDAGLDEAHLGAAQGMTRAEAEARFGAALTARWHSRRAEDGDARYPGGESSAEVLARARAALRGLIAAFPACRRFAVVTHGGVIRRLVQPLLAADAAPVSATNAEVFGLTWEVASDTVRVVGRDGPAVREQPSAPSPSPHVGTHATD